MPCDEDLMRLPGLYRSWDLGILIEEGRIYRIEDCGRTEHGEALFAVYASESLAATPGAVR